MPLVGAGLGVDGVGHGGAVGHCRGCGGIGTGAGGGAWGMMGVGGVGAGVHAWGGSGGACGAARGSVRTLHAAWARGGL